MERIFIPAGEYHSFLETTRYCDSTEFDVNRIIEIYEYLKDKKTEERSYYTEPREIENAHLDFLRVALGRAYFSPKYNQATEDFLKSNYLSQELKKEIYGLLKGKCCSLELELVFNSERNFSDFSKDEIKEIYDSLGKVAKSLDEEENRCKEIHDIFDSYIFVLDGVGPIEYIKERNGSYLPILMLEKTGLPSHASYYSGYGVDGRYLGEKHLFSLYQKFDKFYPDKKNEFVKMINFMRRLTPTEFISNYLLFSRNGFDSDFKQKEDNISVDGTYGATRDLVAGVSLFSLFNNEQSEFDREIEIERQHSIRYNFNQMVDEMNKGKTTGNSRVLREKH